MNIEVYSDGSATSDDRPGGYGFVVVADGVKYSEGNGHMPLASNNDAELEAAIQGLESVKSLVKTFPEVSVTLVSDSQLVLGWASGQYKFRQLDKMDKFKHLQLLVNLMSVKTRWVRGHNGDEHNERCDQLANDARLQVVREAEKLEAIAAGETVIGTKKIGIMCVWFKDKLKVIDLDQNIVEDYNREIHGSRGSMFEIREEKKR